MLIRFALAVLFAASSPLTARTPTPSPTPIPTPVPLIVVSGRILERGSTDPVAGALIALEGSSRSAQSATNGRWSLDLPAGPAVLKVSAENFASHSFALTVSAGAGRGNPAPTDVGDWPLTRVAFEADEITVRGRRETEAPSHLALKSKEIRRIAGIGRDPLRALQTLPGVVTPSDFSGALAVRGGGPNDNAYFLNNVPWPVPFHYGGALSSVHGDIFEGIDFYPAAFPPRWGGVDGAVLDARSRPAKRDQLHGQVDIGLILSEALFEGPLYHQGEGPPKGGWILSGRRSYLEVISKYLPNFTAVPRFWDLSLIGNYDLSPQDKLTFTGLATDDEISLDLKKDDVNSKDFEGEFRLRNTFQSVGLSWQHQGGEWRSTLTPYYLRTTNETAFGQGYGLTVEPNIGGLKEDLRREFGAHELGLGAGVQVQRYDVFGYIFRRSGRDGSGVNTLSDPHGITVSAYATDGYGYLQDRVTLAKGLRVLGGGRWQREDHMGSDSFDPRVSLEWQALPHTLVTAGWGLYSQFPSPRELSYEFGNQALGFNRTEHVVAGIEQDLGSSAGLTSLKMELYYKTYRDLVIEVPDDRIYSNDGSGLSRGLELMLRHAVSRRFFGWLSYSYAQSQRLRPGEPWRDYEFDQPHNVTLVGSYDFTPAWSAGLKFNYHSGPLITPSTRVVDPTTNSGYNLVKGVPFSERLGDYLRLDLRTDYDIRLPSTKINLYIEVINVLNRPNPAGVTYNKDFSERRDVNNLPLLPTFGVGVEF